MYNKSSSKRIAIFYTISKKTHSEGCNAPLKKS